MPVPRPPKTISPSSMFTSGIIPPSGVYESSIELVEPVAPFEVVIVVKTDAPIPKRVSLPSMLPPG